MQTTCRLCATTVSKAEAIAITSECGEGSLRHKIKECLRLVVSDWDLLPKHMCVDCVRKVSYFYEFYLQVMNTQRILQNEHKYNGNVKMESLNSAPVRSADQTWNWSGFNTEFNSMVGLLKYEESIPALNIKDEIYFPTAYAMDDERKRELLRNELMSKKRQIPSIPDSTPSQLGDYLDSAAFANSVASKSDVNRTYKCDMCDKFYARPNDLKIHQKIHSSMDCGDKLHKCNVCNKSFALNSVLNKHKRIHTTEKPFKCDHCDKSFALKTALKIHNTVHGDAVGGDKPFKCDVCDKSFTMNCILTKHKRIHSGEKLYACDVCGKSFTLNGNLMKHKIIHSGIKMFKCDVCDKSFSLNGNLMKHKIIHSGKKLFKCDTCGKSFTLNGNLMKHKMIHSGDNQHQHRQQQMYECDVICQVL